MERKKKKNKFKILTDLPKDKYTICYHVEIPKLNININDNVTFYNLWRVLNFLKNKDSKDYITYSDKFGVIDPFHLGDKIEHMWINVFAIMLSNIKKIPRHFECFVDASDHDYIWSPVLAVNLEGSIYYLPPALVSVYENKHI